LSSSSVRSKKRPFQVGSALGPPVEGLFGARRGGYRVMYRIDIADRIVYVRRVAARAVAYYPRAAPRK